MRINDEYDRHVKANPSTESEAFHHVIETPRTCDKYMEWVPSLSPKEHLEMNREQMLRSETEARRIADEAFREEIRKSDKASADSRRDKDDEMKREEMDFKGSERREKRYQWMFTVGSTILFGLVGLVWGNAILKQPEPQTPPTVINQITVSPSPAPTVINQITAPTK